MVFDVDIYIETTWKGPTKKAGAGMYILEWQGKELHTTEPYTLWMDKSTENEATVRCLRHALERMTKPSNITVHTTCAYVCNVLANNWIERWRNNKWRTSDGEPIRHVEDWCAIDNMLAIHTCTAVSEAHHSYTNIMCAGLQKEVQRHEEQKSPETA